MGSQDHNVSGDKNSHLNGTFSIISNDKAPSPFVRKKNKVSTQNDFRLKDAAKRSSTMRSKVIDS